MVSRNAARPPSLTVNVTFNETIDYQIWENSPPSTRVNRISQGLKLSHDSFIGTPHVNAIPYTGDALRRVKLHRSGRNAGVRSSTGRARYMGGPRSVRSSTSRQVSYISGNTGQNRQHQVFCHYFTHWDPSQDLGR